MILRRLIFTVFIFAAFVLQFTYIPAMHLPFPVYFLIPLGVSVAMFEKEFSGMIFGLLAGILWDAASPLPDGTLALGFAVFAFAAGLLTRYLLRNTLLSALVLTAAASAVFSLAALLYTGFSSGTEILRDLATGMYLPATAVSVLLTLPVYFIIRKTALMLRNEKNV